MTTLQIECGEYFLSVNSLAREWKVGSCRDGDLLVCRGPLLLTPEIEGCAVGAGVVEDRGIQPGGSRLLHASATITGGCGGQVENRIWLLEDRIVCEASYRFGGAHSLEHWSLSSAGGRVQADQIHAFVGVHGGRDRNGTILDARAAVDLSTATHNWMYANAAPRLAFGRDGVWNAVLGGTAVANDFGLELSSDGQRIRHLRFNYGGREFPWKLAGTGACPGPRLQIQFSRSARHEDAHALFTEAMIADGLVERRRHAPEESAWRRPWYCTWGDQVALASTVLRQDAAGQGTYADVKAVLTQEFVLKAAKLIRDRRVNIGTIIIDDGWQDRRGDWNLETAKFPDMRGLVDQLHALDFKVAIWLAPFLVEPTAGILQRRGFTCGPVAKHREIVVDYGQPQVRDWMCEKLDQWFSSAPGGWDIDGLKLDFLAMKIYPDGECHDPEWRGEERMNRGVFRMFDRCIRRHKSVPGLLHAPYNAHWMDCCAALYGEERFDKDVDYLQERPALIEAVAPGAWISPHFNYNVDVVPAFLRRVKPMGGIAQIGKLLCPDVTAEHIEELRGILADWD